MDVDGRERRFMDVDGRGWTWMDVDGRLLKRMGFEGRFSGFRRGFFRGFKNILHPLPLSKSDFKTPKTRTIQAGRGLEADFDNSKR